MTVESGRRLKPTNLGIVLVHGYYKIGQYAFTDVFIGRNPGPVSFYVGKRHSSLILKIWIESDVLELQRRFLWLSFLPRSRVCL